MGDFMPWFSEANLADLSSAFHGIGTAEVGVCLPEEEWFDGATCI